MVAVIGGKLTQDASDSLTGGTDGNGNSVKTFNPNALIDDQSSKAPGVTGSYYEEYDGNRLAGKLEGDGTSVSNSSAGHEEYVYEKDSNGNLVKVQKRDAEGNLMFDENDQPIYETQMVFDGETGYRDDSFDEEYKDGDKPGENFEADESSNPDLNNAGRMGPTQPDYDPTDATSAFIGKNAVVTSANDILVTAYDNMTADMVTATIAVGGYAGVGVGIAVGILYSNVLAYVEDGAVLSAEGDITVYARGGSKSVPADQDKNAALEKAINAENDDETQDVTVGDLTIRAISFTGAGGVAGVGIAAGVVVLNSNVKAFIEGDVVKADSLTVKAVSEYPQVIAATLAASAGVVGVGVSAATVAFNGSVTSAITGDARIGMSDEAGNTVGNVNVLSEATTDATTLAAAIAGGYVAVNGALSLAINRSMIETFIGQGVSLKSTGDVNVKATVATEANTYIVGVTIGAVAAGLSAAISILEPTVLTYIGTTPHKQTPTAGAATGTIGSLEAVNVSVENNTTTTASSTVLSVAGGAVAVKGNALLVFNNTVAYAAINKMPVKAAGNINVDAYMNSQADSFLAANTGGAVAVGVTVSYVRLGSENVAMIDTTGAAVRAVNINVYAGRDLAGKRNSSLASATAVAASVAGIALNLNAAVADNDSTNSAEISGSGSLTATEDLNVGANGTATANAEVRGISSGLISVAASVAVALLRSEQNALISGGHIKAGSLKVISNLNGNIENSSISRLKTGSGGLITLIGNVAVAYGRSSSTAKIDTVSVDVTDGIITIGSYGNAGALSEITNLSAGAITANVMVGAAYSQAAFAAILNIPQNSTVTAGSVTIETLYTTRATADVTPSAGGVQLSLATIGVNLALADTASNALASLTGKGILTAGSVKINADGTATAKALTQTPKISVDIVNIAANTVVAILSAGQTACIEGVTIATGGNVEVISVLNNGAEEGAVAELGSNFDKQGYESLIDGSINLSVFSAEINSAIAISNALNHAYIEGANIGSETERAGQLKVMVNGSSFAIAEIQKSAISIGLISLGLTTLYGEAKGDFKAYIDTTGGDIHAASIIVDNTYTSLAESETTQAVAGVHVSLVDIGGNLAISKVTTNAESAIKGNGTISTSGTIQVTATGIANASSGVMTPTISLSYIKIAANILTATLEAVQKAYIENITVKETGGTSVSSTLNASPVNGAKAILGSAAGSLGANVSYISGSASVATATSKALNHAYVDGASFGSDSTRAGALTVTSTGSSIAIADISAGAILAGYISLGTALLKAYANGDYQAYVNTTGALLNVENLSVSNTYKADARAKTTQPIGGTISGYEAEVNIAKASVGINAEAAIKGNGTVETPGSITVQATGTATADAGVMTPTISLSGIKIAVNILTATLATVQKAYIDSVEAEAGSISVKSILNNENQTGAVAKLGSSAGDFGADVALAGVEVHSANATANNTNHAYIRGADINTGGAISVQSIARSYANARVDQTAISLGLLTLGVTLLEAEAKGDFAAYVDSSELTCGSLEVKNNFNSTANAVAAQPSFGVGVSAISVAGNYADANAATTASAYVKDSNLTLDNGNVTVGAEGIVQSNAVVESPKITISGVKVAISKAESTLSAVQKAYISGGSIQTAGNVNIYSWQNKDSETTGAVASLGSNTGGVSVSLISGAANIANATADATNQAYVSGTDFGSIDRRNGTLNIESKANSYAKAGFINDIAGVSLTSLGILTMTAESKGIFKAYLDSTNAVIYINDLTISNNYKAISEAKSTQPGKGVSVTLVNGQVNFAKATTETNASSYITGNGSVNAVDINIQTIGSDSKAIADIDAAKTSISGVKVAANIALASMKVTQNAYISGQGTINATGAVSVLSILKGTKSEAEAGANGGTSVSLATGDGNLTTAESASTVNAYIEGNVTVVTDGDVNVGAELGGAVTSRAQAPDANITLLSIGVVKVIADFAQDSVNARIAGNAKVTGGRVDVIAVANGTATAIAEQPNTTVSGVDVSVIYAEARVGTRTVAASVGSGATVQSTGTEMDDGVNVAAASSTILDAYSNHGTSVSLVGVGKYTIKTYVGNHSTIAKIDGTVIARNNIWLSAADSINASASTSASNAGLANVGKSTATSTVDSQTGETSVGADAVLEAREDINIYATTVSDLTAAVNANGIALGDFGAVYAATALNNRNTRFRAGDEAKIVSRYGNIYINVLADTARQNATATMGGFGIISGGNGPESSAYIKTNTTADIGNGVVITALFGVLGIAATSKNDIYAYAYRHMGTLAGNNQSKATIDAIEDTIVTIGGSGAQSYLNSRNTDISSYLYQKLHAKAVSYTISAGSLTEAKSYVTTNANTKININNAFVGGIDSLTINAKVIDMYVHSESYAEIVGLTGKVYATSSAGGSSTAEVNIGSGADLAGQRINIAAVSPLITNQVVFRDATAKGNTVVNWVWKTIQRVVDKLVKWVSKIPFIGWFVKWVWKKVVEWVDVLVKEILYSDEKEYLEGKMTSTGKVDICGNVHLGGAAAGMFVDIKEDGTVAYSGLEDGYQLASSRENNTIILGDLYNEDLGELTLSASSANSVKGNITVFNNNYLPNIVINNWSPFNLILSKINAVNGQLGSPTLNMAAEVKYELDTEKPNLNIFAHEGTALTFGKSIDTGDGNLNITMNGGDVNTAANEGQGTPAAVWANRLEVQNAGNIGSAANRFNAYILDIPEIRGTNGIIKTMPARPTYIALEASGDIYAALTHVIVNLDSGDSGNPYLTLDRISAGGKADLLIHAPNALMYQSNEGLDDMINVSEPGRRDTLVLLAHQQTGDITIKDSQGNDTTYKLRPNGMLVINEAITIRGSHYYVADSETTTGSGSTQTIAHYYLPGGDMVAVDRGTGKIVNVIAFNGKNGKIYDLDAIEFVEVGGLPIIRFIQENFNIIYTYEAATGKLKDVKIEITNENLQNGGVTIYVETKPGDLGWTLPDGTRVYYKNAFLKDGTEVKPVVLGEHGPNYLHLLEPFDAERDLYHVVEFNEENIFVEAYIYTKKELLNAAVVELGRGMLLREAEQAAQNVLNSYKQSSFSASSTPAGISGEVKSALQSQLTNNWSFTVTTQFTTEQITVTVGEGEEQKQETRTIINDIQISVSLTEVVPEGETPETTTINKTIDVSANKYETALTGEELTSTTELTSGTKQDDKALGAEFGKGVLGNRSGTIYVNKQGGIVPGMTVKNGAYNFNLSYNLDLNAYLVEPGTYFGFEKNRYEELLGKYFILSEDAATIIVYQLDQSGSGEITIARDDAGNITSSSLNGGYHVVNGGYLFVDEPAVTDANAGILYLVDRAVVVTPDGHVYPVGIEGNHIGENQDLSNMTISFAPGMQQMMDGDGNLLYSNNGEISTVKLADSIPVYSLRVPKTNHGEVLYSVFDVWTGKYEDGEYTAEQVASYQGFGRYQISMIYRDIDGLNIVRPVDGGFTVTYTDPVSLNIPVDARGYGIISRDKRMLLEDDGPFKAGTVLYLDENQNIMALFTPEGKFYRYEQNTFYTPDITEDQEIYTAYRGQGSGEDLDLITYFSAGSQTMLHEVMTGLYMAVPDESGVTVFGAADTMNSFYAEADFFGFNSEGKLVLLVKKILDTPYQSIAEEDVAFDGAAVMKINDPAGKILLRILELNDGRIIFLFDDNTWIDSVGNTGFIPRPINRTVEGYDGNSRLLVNSLSAPNVNIRFAGDNTTLTDNGADNINIISDNVVIIAEDSGNIFTADNPLSIAPNVTDTVNLRLIKTDAGAAYDASAYVVASRAGDNVNLHDTDIASGGLLDLFVADGNAGMNNVGINEGGEMDLTIGRGNITMNDVDVSGTLDMSTGSGDITMNNVDISGGMTAETLVGGVNMNDVDVTSTGVLGITTGQGDVTVDQVSSDGTLQITATDGNLLMKDEESILSIGKNSTAGEGDTWADIGGDIGSETLTFKVNIQLDENAEAQPLNIKNAADIYLKQETGIDTNDDSLPTYGRDENGNIGEHDEAVNGMEEDDETVNVVMPSQTAEEIVAQLNNGNLTKEQLLALISGILTGTEIKLLLGIDDEAVATLVSSLDAMDAAELATLVSSLNLVGVTDLETELDLTVLDGDDSQALEELAVKLGLPGTANKADILAQLRNKLGLEDTADIEGIKAAYQTYYDGLLAQYRADVVNSYRASIEDKLNAESRLTDAEIRYLLDMGLSEEAAAITVLLAAALDAQQPVVESDDGAGNITYLQATDQDGNQLYVDGVDDNGEPIQIPVYVMESRIEDNELFAAYWDSLTEGQKLDLIQAAWELANYPEAEESAIQPRIFILNIGKSTGNSSIYNEGNIIVTQQEGTFTAKEVISKYGDVALTSPDIAGVDGKTNVYGEEISLTATTGSITGLNAEEKSWPLTTIANIEDEDKKNEAFGETGGNTWVLVRNPATGEIEMQFAIDYTAVGDLNIDSATIITANASGDIEITEVTGDMGVNIIEAGGKVTLTAPGSIYDVRAEDETSENIIAGNGAMITSVSGSVGTNGKYIDNDIDGTLQVSAEEDININDSGSLILVADSNSGQVNVNAVADLTLSNTTGNLKIGPIEAGGTALITSTGGITAGDKLGNTVHVKAPDVSLTAQNGSIGTADTPVDVDTDADGGGKLSAKAANGSININELIGDLVIDTIILTGDGNIFIVAEGAIEVGTISSTGGGDVSLTAGNGDITETDGTDSITAAAAAKTAADKARSAADLAAAQAAILQNYVSNILPELLGRPAAQEALNKASADLAAAEQQLSDVNMEIVNATDELAVIQAEKNTADNELANAESALAQAIADREALTDPADIAAQDAIIAGLRQEVSAAERLVADKQNKLDSKNAEISALQNQALQLEDQNIPELTQIRNDKKNALDEIDAQLAQAQIDLVDTKTAESNSLETAAAALENTAASKLAAATASGIYTEGDLNLNLLNGGTIGEEDNALGITVAGNLTVTAGEGNLDGLYLDSGADLSLAPVTVNGDVVINSLGDIQGIAGISDTDITADNAELNSPGGEIGAAADPLVTNVDRITATGNNVYIKNRKSLVVDTVTGDTVNLDVAGNITAGTAAGEGDNNNIIAGDLILNAGGSVGTEGERLVSDTGELTVNAKELYLQNNSGELKIKHIKIPGKAEILTEGSVIDSSAGGNINAGSLNLSAFGNIGGTSENLLDVYVPKSTSLTAVSTYGSVNLKNWFKHGGSDSNGDSSGGGGASPKPVIISVADTTTGVTVTGEGIDARAKLIVTEGPEHSDDSCQACVYIRELMNAGKVIANYNISLTKGFSGMVKVSIPVGPEYEGRTLSILYYRDGEINSFDAKVKEGMVSFETDALGTYAVLDDKYTLIPYSGQYTITDGKKFPMAESGFKDVEPADWYFAAIAYVHALKIMAGVTEDLFDPQGITTRAMLVAILYRLDGNPNTGTETRFADVEYGAWYTNAVIWAEEHGIIKGYDNNLFGTNDPITREQLAVILYRYTMGKGKDVSATADLTGFTDADQVSGFATDAMKWAVALGLIKGKGDQNIDPTALATRAEISAIIQRYLETYAKVLLVDYNLLELKQ